MISTIARIAIPLVARRAAPVKGAVAARSAFLPSAASSFSHSLLRVPFIAHSQQMRMYSAGGALSQDDIKSRIMEILTGFEKVDPSKVTPTAGFTNDLGLDSLDAVEVVMAIEEEFSIEIPDEDADRITTVGEAIEYISKSPEAL